MGGYLMMGFVLAVTFGTGEPTRMVSLPAMRDGVTARSRISANLTELAANTTGEPEDASSAPRPASRRICYDILPQDPVVLYDEDNVKNFDFPSFGFDVDDASENVTHVCDLRAYDADKEADVIREWHDMIKDVVDEKDAVKQLLLESCNDEEKDIESMCAAFMTAKRANKCVPGLTKAECLTVTMYTAEVGNSFYREYNNASSYGVWAPYRVYTSLLFSAIKKLAAIEPISNGESLYRGMRVACRPPGAARVYWKTFTSTSLNPMVASFFGRSTSLVFEPPATVYGARIKNLSLIESEDEVLIAPFEVFDFQRAEKQVFYFRMSDRQDLIYGSSATHLQFPGIILLNLVLYVCMH